MIVSCYVCDCTSGKGQVSEVDVHRRLYTLNPGISKNYAIPGISEKQ